MAADLYLRPDLYQRAFAWRDPQRDIDAVRGLWVRFGTGRCASLLDVACGPAPHAPACAEAGIAYHGFDLSEPMLTHARDANPAATLWLGDLQAGPFGAGPFDLATCFLGSLTLPSMAALEQHLAGMAEVVRRGGLYVLDWCVVVDDPDGHEDEWPVSDSEGELTVTYAMRWTDQAADLIEEEVVVSVHAGAEAGSQYRACMPQVCLRPEQLRRVAEAAGQWRWLGAWNDWDLNRPLPDAVVTRPLVILQRVDDACGDP